MTNLPNKPETPVNASFYPELQSATGSLKFPMTNDYMFRAVLQSNQKALTGLISSLLHIPMSHIRSVEIKNPIVLGESCYDKECRLDINVLLNDHTLINLEMQVIGYANWHDRSLLYLCRNFDSLSHGQDYSELKPVMHIGILDYTLFPDTPQFYASYKLMNTKNYRIYSDKIALNVLDLTQEELATEEDRQWKIDRWARVFKAATWEELKMTAKNDEHLTETANAIFAMNSDYMVLKQCLEREDYQRDLRTWKRDMAKLNAEIAEKNAEIERLKAENEKLKASQAASI